MPAATTTAPALTMDSARLIFSGMWRRLRSLAIAIAVTLGLILQGMGMPVMAASVAKSECALAHANSSGPSGNNHIGMQLCQAPCIAPGALPRSSSVAVPFAWAAHQFAASASGIPPGLNPAPDPFPPKSLALA